MDKTEPKPFVFVLMPFQKEFDDIYQVGIKAACKDAGAYCERVDEQMFTENILERLYNQIGKADIIVSEMTGRNANVFYETGYAHALNKRVILLTQRAEDIPFDLKLFPHIVYGGSIATLKSALEDRIRWCIANPQDSLTKVEMNLEFFMNGVLLKEGASVSMSLGVQAELRFLTHQVILELSIHNPTNTVVDPRYFSIALLLPEGVRMLGNSSLVRSSTKLPAGGYIHAIKQNNTLFPSGWDSLRIPVEVSGEELKDESFEMTLRVFTVLGPLDYLMDMTFFTKDGE